MPERTSVLDLYHLTLFIVSLNYLKKQKYLILMNLIHYYGSYYQTNKYLSNNVIKSLKAFGKYLEI